MKRILTHAAIGCLALSAAACSAGGPSVEDEATPNAVATSALTGATTPAVSRVRTTIDASGRTQHLRDCGDPADGKAHCKLLVQSDAAGAVTPMITPSGWGATDLALAYGVALSQGAGRTVAIVDPYDDPNVESDLGVYRAQYGLPSCTTANGCFKKVNQNGATSPLPSTIASGNNAAEIALDVEMVSAVCPFCKILLVEANSTFLSDMLVAEGAATASAGYVSNSWGAGEFSGETSNDTVFNKPGISIFASGGDDGYSVLSYPSVSTYVTSVGGTVLSSAPGTFRLYSETVWSGTGSGCSAYVSKPSWQHDASCAKRTVDDVAAVASGVAVYDSLGFGGWIVAGGTSVASPLVAGIYANTDNRGATPALSYTTTTFDDVTSGSDGSCSGSYLCTGVAGYDGPTGNGTPTATNLVRYNTLVGDVNGDGKADGFAVNDTNLFVTLSSGSSFGSAALWLNGGFYGSQATLLADVNGDGRADAVAVNNNNVFVSLSSGSGFGSPANWFNAAFYGTRGTLFADVTGDGRADGIAVNNGNVYVLPSTGSGFGSPALWFNGAFYGTIANLVGDVNGDGRADVIAVNNLDTYVMLSTGSGFSAPALWSSASFYGTMTTVAADVNGDGRKDLVAVNSGSIYVMLSTGSGFGAPALWLNGSFYGTHVTQFADVNGDGRADGVAVNDTSIWVLPSTGSGFSAPALWLNGSFYGSH